MSTRSLGVGVTTIRDDLIFSDEEMQMSDIQHHPPRGKSNLGVIIFNYHCHLDYFKPREKFLYNKGDYESMRTWLSNSNSNSNLDSLSWSNLEKRAWRKLHQMRSVYLNSHPLENHHRTKRPRSRSASNLGRPSSWRKKLPRPSSCTTPIFLCMEQKKMLHSPRQAESWGDDSWAGKGKPETVLVTHEKKAEN